MDFRVGRLLLVALLAVAAGAPGARAATTSGGLRVGLALASLQNTNYAHDERNGIDAGAFVDFGLAPSFAVRVGAAYVMKGLKTGEVTLALDYLEFPVLAKASVAAGDVKPFLLAGFAPAIKLDAELRARGNEASYGDHVHSVDFGWAIGAGLELPGKRRLQFDVRYTGGMRAVFDFNDPQDTDSDDKNEIISAGIGITL
jgi:hypothetical protein